MDTEEIHHSERFTPIYYDYKKKYGFENVYERESSYPFIDLDSSGSELVADRDILRIMDSYTTLSGQVIRIAYYGFY